MSYIKPAILISALLAVACTTRAQELKIGDELCQKQQSAREVFSALKIAIGSTDSEDLACLFHRGVIDIEFDKTHWLTGSEQFKKQYSELLESGFDSAIKAADETNSQVDDKNHTISIKDRIIIKYGDWGESVGYKIIDIRDLLYPSHFQNFHSEINLENWFIKLRLAIKNDDKQSVAAMSCYPITIRRFSEDNNVTSFVLKTESEFISHYSDVITAHTKNVIAATKWPNLWQNSEGIMLGQGDLWIYPRDLSQCIGLISNGPGIEKLDAQDSTGITTKIE